MVYLASGASLLILGGTVAMIGVPVLLGVGWSLVALGCILVVTHVAVGPTVPEDQDVA